MSCPRITREDALFRSSVMFIFTKAGIPLNKLDMIKSDFEYKNVY